MGAEAALSGVQAQAGLGIGVVGKLCAAVQVDGRVGFAGGDDLHAARRQQGTQPDAEGKSEVLLRLAVQASAKIVAAVSGIENHYKASRGSRRGLGGGYR